MLGYVASTSGNGKRSKYQRWTRMRVCGGCVREGVDEVLGPSTRMVVLGEDATPCERCGHPTVMGLVVRFLTPRVVA